MSRRCCATDTGRPSSRAGRCAATDLAVPRIDGDVRDRDALLAAARGMDGVIHTAALVSVWQKDRADFDRVNVGGLETVVDVCAAHGIPRLVVTSSFLALPPAGRRRPLEANDYQRSKVRAREVVRAAVSRGVPIVSVTPGVVYGPGIESEGNLVGRMIRDHLAGRLPGIIGARRTWSFSYVEDVADAHVRAMERGDPGDDYIAGGENAAQERAFEIVRDLTGAPLPRRIPTVLAHLAGARRGPQGQAGCAPTAHAGHGPDPDARLASGQPS